MQKPSIIIRKVQLADIDQVNGLALRSKSYWNYDAEFIQQCRDELTYTEKNILDQTSHFYLIEMAIDTEKKIQGFYLLESIANTTFELDALFVEPQVIGRGLGRKLFDHAIEQACRSDCLTINIQSDPHAVDFYSSMGCELVGQLESESIPGRMLPLMVFTLV